ncbi:MAG: hypothetical protein A2X12_04400 [Bacteroidetes bacterium GWE2_29_8]|nr:MAG: hypothetical protein A2X12_04400 [Bacteroidetes bacterium GWE2_29_8]OFY18045.1 MAG: hypothetical protein A2X02_09780 [Bacteroidetes bacterium GWF2_29_10]
MLNYIENKNIDRSKWDRCIRSSINETIYAYSWYLDFVCDSWDALVEDDYISVFPLVFKTKFGVTYIYQPYFAQQLGLFSLKTISVSKTNEFLQSIPYKFKYVDFCLNTYNRTSLTEYTISEKVTYQLDLINNYDVIYKSFSNNNKRNIKKSAKHNVNISQDVLPIDIIKIFRKNRGKTVIKWGDTQYESLKKILYFFLRNNCLKMYGAYNDKNTLIAGAFFVFSANKAIFLFSGNTPEGKEKGAMFAIINEFIKEFSSTNVTLDFEGSDDTNLARFYAGFGSQKTIYNHLKRNHLNFIENTFFVLYRSPLFVFFKNTYLLCQKQILNLLKFSTKNKLDKEN